MAQYNFGGDVKDISERQLQFINSVILQLGLENSEVLFESVGTADDNYVANVKRITIDGPHRCLKVIAKIAPTLESVREAMNTSMMFMNEHIMYTEVLPKFLKLQKDANIPEEEQFKYAKCYGSFAEQPDEVILLEDLKLSDFVMIDRFSSLSNDCVKSVLKNIAILHSLSFVLRHTDQETYRDFKNNLADDWSTMAKMEHIKTYFQALEDDTLAILEDQRHVEFLRGKISNTLNLAIEFAKTDVNNKYTVIQQGDCKTNNVMFSFEGEKLIASVLIDYQNSRNTSPVCDILYFVFNCTDYETRREKFYDWVEFYYSELENSLSKFNLKANLVYPRNRMSADLKQYSNLLFGLTIFLTSLLIRKTKDSEKIKDAMSGGNLIEDTQQLLVSSLDNDTKNLFKIKVVELIESCIELELM